MSTFFEESPIHVSKYFLTSANPFFEVAIFASLGGFSSKYSSSLPSPIKKFGKVSVKYIIISTYLMVVNCKIPSIILYFEKIITYFKF